MKALMHLSDLTAKVYDGTWKDLDNQRTNVLSNLDFDYFEFPPEIINLEEETKLATGSMVQSSLEELASLAD